MLRIGSIVWGVTDVARAVEFWTAALRLELRYPAAEDWAALAPIDGVGPRMSLKRVQSGQARRHHLDLYADDQAAEVERLLALGARRVEGWDYEEGADYVVLCDPDGNRFCVVQR
ncbi:VOC family protein [Nannocystis pusilla]|uniref:VOC family protein n=1 Tax=Nannocystis pusilla TaxID=889268 RepID=UPI003DA2B392